MEAGEEISKNLPDYHRSSALLIRGYFVIPFHCNIDSVILCGKNIGKCDKCKMFLLVLHFNCLGLGLCGKYEVILRDIVDFVHLLKLFGKKKASTAIKNFNHFSTDNLKINFININV